MDALDMSDDEELQRLREAALKSKRRPGVQEKREDSNPVSELENHKISPDNSQVPAQLALQTANEWNDKIQLQTIFQPFYAPLTPQSQMILPMNLSQAMQTPQMNNSPFPPYPHQYLPLHRLSMVNRIHPHQRSNPQSGNKNIEFGKVSIPGYQSSNLIVITGNDFENTVKGFKHVVLPLSNSAHVKDSQICDDAGIVRPQDKWTADKSQLVQGKDEKVRMSKFERYKADESSDEEDNCDSPNSDIEDNSSESVADLEDRAVESHKVQKQSMRLSARSEEDKISREDRETTRRKDFESSDEMMPNGDAEMEDGGPVSSTSSEASSKSPERRRVLSFSDGVEDLHLDIPDTACLVNVTKCDNRPQVDRQDEDGTKLSGKKEDRNKSPSHKQPSRTIDRERCMTPRNREKVIEKSGSRKRKSSRSERRPSKKRKTKHVSPKIQPTVSVVRRVERPKESSKRVPPNANRKYDPTRQEEHYDRATDVTRDRVYRKVRYCEEREAFDYPSEYREYPRSFSHHQRCYDKNDPYLSREAVDDHYFCPDEGRTHDDLVERGHENFYRDYYELPRVGHEDHYRYSPPKRYRGSEREYYHDIPEREVQRLEAGRRYEGDHFSGRVIHKRYLNDVPIPSLLDGMYAKGDLEKRQISDVGRDNFRPLKSAVVRSEVREHPMQIESQPRTKENRKNLTKTKNKSFEKPRDKRDNEPSVKKLSRKVVELRNGATYSDQEVGSKSKAWNQETGQAKPQVCPEKRPPGSSDQEVTRKPIHHRLGLKPKKKSPVPCKKTTEDDLRHHLSCHRTNQLS